MCKQEARHNHHSITDTNPVISRQKSTPQSDTEQEAEDLSLKI